MFFTFQEQLRYYARVKTETARVSIILDLPDKVSETLKSIQSKITTQLKNVSHQSQHLHITIALADNIPVNKVPEVTQKLKEFAQDVNLKLEISSPQQMVNQNNQGVIYFTVNDEELVKLNNRAKHILQQYGGTFQYPFKAHVTLAFLEKPTEQDLKTLHKEFKIPVQLGPAHVNISIFDGEKWNRLAVHRLSKRILAKGNEYHHSSAISDDAPNAWIAPNGQVWNIPRAGHNSFANWWSYERHGEIPPFYRKPQIMIDPVTELEKTGWIHVSSIHSITEIIFIKSMTQNQKNIIYDWMQKYNIKAYFHGPSVQGIFSLADFMDKIME